MLIDIFFLGAMLAAVFKGVRNGLVVGVFSMVGWIIGLIAAVRFSDSAAKYLEGVIDVSPRWLSIIAFTAVFIAVMLLVRIGAGIIVKTMEITMMGWINQLGGIFFYVVLYALIFSVIIYFAEKVKLLNEETISSSRVYHAFQPVFITLKSLF